MTCSYRHAQDISSWACWDPLADISSWPCWGTGSPRAKPVSWQWNREPSLWPREGTQWSRWENFSPAGPPLQNLHNLNSDPWHWFFQFLSECARPPEVSHSFMGDFIRKTSSPGDQVCFPVAPTYWPLFSSLSYSEHIQCLFSPWSNCPNVWIDEEGTMLMRKVGWDGGQ